MKCHWTGIAEIGVAIPLGLVGIFEIFSKRKETFNFLSGTGASLGVLAILFPTTLIGVCANPDMTCNMIMRPGLILSGALVIGASVVVFVSSRKMAESSCMNLFQLALKEHIWEFISQRSGCPLRLAGSCICTLTTTLLMRGAENSLRLAIDRLGADIVVVPTGSEAKIESALLMGVPAKFWMPQENVDKIAAIPGVEAVSPQLYLATLTGASCCSVSDMFMIAYDPETDFTIQPWLQKKIG